ncbi:MAG: hypothetical protein KatS3mg103_0948 [Phycisphaerales bacterium]|nr:MAG: hypothetical protein KatS3mg103_0948 [Phycisphaerales bacterium]
MVVARALPSSVPTAVSTVPRLIDLGTMPYAQALDLQRQRQEELIRSRGQLPPDPGTVYLVEHPPVITLTPRARDAGHVLASERQLAGMGIALHPTDRGGDVTYHGPGQIVAYPIVDLQRLGHQGKPLGLHGYMRLLEQAVIDTIERWGLHGHRDPTATGVWIERPPGPPAKIAAMGVRVRRWVTMHGLALNVRCNLDHFATIVPCGLVGRPVTSMLELLGDQAPDTQAVKAVLGQTLIERLAQAAREAPKPET